MFRKDWESIISGNEGGFIQKLAYAFIEADRENREKIASVFPELAESYKIWYES